MKKLTQVILVWVLLCLAFSGQTESESIEFEKHTKINHNWPELSQSEYVDNLVACELKVQEHKWSKNIWPEANKSPKPAFAEVAEPDEVRAQVLENLKMQSVLANRFNTTITDNILQHDLDRMAGNTKDAKGLKALFALFDNNSDTIAQCISRPYLVKQKTQNNYDYNSEIHAATKVLAETELKTNLKSSQSDELQAQVSTVTFEIEQEIKAEEKNLTELEQQSIKLSADEFSEKVKLLQNSSLQEKSYGFIKTEILEQSADSIQVKTLMWQKPSFNLWLQAQTESAYIPKLQKSSLKLPEITGSNNLVDVKAGVEGDRWESKFYVPSTRHYHTAIWSGSEMIIWGGNDGNILNTGGRYDPVTDSWKATSLGINAPIGRSSHTAIWTGSEMIVWGGNNNGVSLNTGGRYDPIDDSWIASSVAANVPSGRFIHTAIWSGSEMIVWGGFDGSNLKTGGRYDPISDSWETTSVGSNVPSGRRYHTAIWSGSEMIVWGGISGSLRNTGGRYDPVDNSWIVTSVAANVPSGRQDHTAIWSGSEMIVWGGINGVNKLNTGGRYDPANDSWEATSVSANAPSGRQNHIAIWTESEMIVWGGASVGFVNSGGRYDPVSDSWEITSVIANVPSGRQDHTAIWSGSEMIVWGGNSVGLTNTGGRYDPDTDNWETTSVGVKVPSARHYHTAIWSGSEMIVWGGYGGNNTLNSGGRYNPATDSWEATSLAYNVPSGRRFHTVIWSGTEMIVWGGGGYSGYLNTGGRYNPATDSWEATSVGANVPSIRKDHTAIWNGNEMIVWGGYDGNDLNTGARYDPVTDSWKATSVGANVPTSRRLHTATWGDDKMIVWGGISSSFRNTGGRYDPVTDSWDATSVGANVPSGRYFHTAIWSGSEMIIWGGYDGNDLNTGGRYNPTNDSWAATSVGANVPSVRQDHTAVWSGSEMIVWGGYHENSLNTNTGGRYKPITNSWEATGVSTNVPIGRFSHTAIWSGSEMIVWGGYTPSLSNSLGIYYPYDSYAISGTLTGLNGDQVILQNNGDDDLSLIANGPFEFNTAIFEGTDYAVTTLTDPQTPAQTCTVVNGSGTNIMADVTDVVVNCVNDFFNVGVTVTGLAAGNSVFVENNGSDLLKISTNGVLMNFVTQVGNGLDYSITFDTHPTSPNQTCSIASGEEAGTVSGADVNIAVTCVTDVYAIGGTVSGLDPSNSVLLQNNGSDDLTVSADGAFLFGTLLNDQSAYDVTVMTQPATPNQVCTVSHGSGVIAGADVTDVAINCVTVTYSVGGSITGLANGNFATLSMNAGDELLLVNSNSSFVFSNTLEIGSTYDVTVLSNPNTPNQQCSVTNGSGTLMGADITDIEVSCEINRYLVGGYIMGLIPDNYMVLQNNSADDLTLRNEGAFAFATPLDDQESYSISIQNQPDDPIQTCEMLNTNGEITGQDVNNVFIYCEFGDDLIFRHGFDEPDAISQDLWELEEWFFPVN